MGLHLYFAGLAGRTDQYGSRAKLHRARIGIDRGIPYNSSFTFYSKYDIFFCQTAHITAIIRHFGHYYDKIRTVCHQLLSFRIHIHTQLRAAA